MATFGEGSDRSGRMMPRSLAKVQQLETRAARRRLSQARHRATLKRLFGNLRRIVYHQSDITASKVRGPECGEGRFLQGEGLWSEVGTDLEMPPPHPYP